MYDDLARAQRPSALEWLVVNALIPSVLVTFVLHSSLASHAGEPSPDISTLIGYPEVRSQPPMPVPDAFPVLITMSEPAYPEILRRAGAEDHVLLRALVTPDGRVDSASILAVQAVYPAFVASAQLALSRARFRPALFGGRPGGAWITILIDFTLTREAT